MSNDKLLPLRIRQGIRDEIEASDSRLNLKFSSVKKTLGHALTLQTEWAMLWLTLQSHYPDNSTFVPSIVSTVCAFCDAFVAWLDQPESGSQVDTILDDLAQRHSLTIKIELSSHPNASRPTALWRSTEAGFVICLPKSPPEVQVSTLIAGFTTDLVSLTSPPPPSTTRMTPDPASSTLQDPEDWEAVSEATPLTSAFGVLPFKPAVHQQALDILPDISTIERPEELLKRPPYLLIVKQEAGDRVSVQGSHHSSLVLLEQYLKRWTRTRADWVDRVSVSNKTICVMKSASSLTAIVNQPPVVKIELEESVFGFGLLYDTLILQAGTGKELSASLVRVFVESVLGYEPVPNGTGTWACWEYRRINGFRC